MDRWTRDRICRVVCIVAVAFTLGVVSLAGVSAQDSTSALASLGLPELTVTITDAGIEAPTEAAAGLTYVTLDNQTESISDATFVAQPEGRTLEQITADLQQVDTLPDWVYTTAFVGGPVAPAGGTGAAIVDLSAGNWLIAQTDTETPLSPAVLKVTGEGAAATSGDVPSELKVTMQGYKFDFPDEVAAGPQVWEVTNDDPVPHFAVLLYYPGPVTAADVETFLMTDPSTPNPNFTIDPSKLEDDGGYLPLHTQGKISWLEMDLKPGSYIALCFMSDQGAQVPHAFMGMYDVFTVPGDVATPTS
jgi:hypothetical protein